MILPSRDLVWRNWHETGMPVTGSSLAFSWRIVHDGEMRRSADTVGGDDGLSGGMVICTFMSGADWRDMICVSCDVK
jgi:hypothetical protein